MLPNWLLTTGLLLRAVAVLSSVVLEPHSLRGREFQSTGFPLSLASQPAVANVSIHWLLPATPRSECYASTLGASARRNNGSEFVALAVVTDFTYCFPQDMAKAAAENGFSMLIVPTIFNYPGYWTLTTWIRDETPIPIMEVSIRNEVIQTFAFTKANITFDKNPYRTWRWLGPQIPALMIVFGVSALKLSICLPIVIAEILLDPPQFLTKLVSTHAILMTETIASAASMLSVFDFAGQLHIFSCPLWFGFLMTTNLLTYAGTHISLLNVLEAEAMLEGRGKLPTKKRRFLNSIFGAFVGMNMCCFILIGWLILYHPLFPAIQGLSFFFFELIIGIMFVRKKHKIIKLVRLYGTERVSGLLLIEQKSEIDRMTYFLALGGFLMLGYVASVPVSSIGVYLGSPEIFTCSLLVGETLTTLIGLSHLLALPYRITGVQFRSDGKPTTSTVRSRTSLSENSRSKEKYSKEKDELEVVSFIYK
jgi:hypothetical protein